MNIYKYDIVFQEVPNHIALAFYACGCPLKCPGCHSPELWTERSGFRLSLELYDELLKKYLQQADCVLFLGGEWHAKELAEFLRIALDIGYKTALYTGLDDISDDLKIHLTFLKTGAWDFTRGPLGSPTTNQVFKDLTTGSVLNHLFQR
jgi:anaerobic ribonucleoside-triphosphate reductase activating protein